MKNFTTEEIRDLFGQVVMGEISFSQMTKVLNERMNEMVSEAGKPTYKKGDFLVKEYNDGVQYIFILDYIDDEGTIYYHCSYGEKYNTIRVVDDFGIGRVGDAYHKCLRYATDREKELLVAELYKVGKRWNAEEKCVEDIPVRKFKKGDKVRIKEGISSKTHESVFPFFTPDVDDFIGVTMTVYRYTHHEAGCYVVCDESGFVFHEDWLEPYVEELKEGDLAIFWNDDKKLATIRIYYDRSNESDEHLWYKDTPGFIWANAVKFESVEQYRKLLKGEI